MSNKEILVFNTELIRCIDCLHCGGDGTICRYAEGKDTKPDNFCSEGEKEDERQ